MKSLSKHPLWLLVAVASAAAVGDIALNRGEPINALWPIVAAVCVYALAYRFYAAWIAAKVLVFGHHFAAIAGPSPLVGSTLAAEFCYLPVVFGYLHQRRWPGT